MKSFLGILFLLVGILCFASDSAALETIVSVDFSKSQLSFRTFEGHAVVELKDLAPNGEIGAPGLPVLSTYVAIPGNMLAQNVEILHMACEALPGEYEIYPQQVPLCISGTEVHPFKKNMDIYRSPFPYPRENATLTHQGDLAGKAKKAGPPPIEGRAGMFVARKNAAYPYRSRARTFCGLLLAMANTEVPDWTRIWARVRAAVSAAKSA